MRDDGTAVLVVRGPRWRDDHAIVDTLERLVRSGWGEKLLLLHCGRPGEEARLAKAWAELGDKSALTGRARYIDDPIRALANERLLMLVPFSAEPGDVAAACERAALSGGPTWTPVLDAAAGSRPGNR